MNNVLCKYLSIKMSKREYEPAWKRMPILQRQTRVSGAGSGAREGQCGFGRIGDIVLCYTQVWFWTVFIWRVSVV